MEQSTAIQTQVQQQTGVDATSLMQIAIHKELFVLLSDIEDMITSSIKNRKIENEDSIINKMHTYSMKYLDLKSGNLISAFEGVISSKMRFISDSILGMYSRMAVTKTKFTLKSLEQHFTYKEKHCYTPELYNRNTIPLDFDTFKQKAIQQKSIIVVSELKPLTKKHASINEVLSGQIIDFPIDFEKIYILRKSKIKSKENNKYQIKFNPIYLEVSRVKIIGNDKKPREYIHICEYDVHGFCTNKILIQNGKPLRKMFVGILQRNMEVINMLRQQEAVYITFTPINDYKDAHVVSSHMNNGIYVLNNKYNITEYNIDLETIRVVASVINDVHNKSTRTLPGEVYIRDENRPEAEPKEANKFKLVKLRQTVTKYTGTGTPHASHASPRMHVRKGYWRKNKKGEDIWVRETIVNKGADPTLYR